MLIIEKDIVIPFNEVQIKAIRSSGPGGQHVNKVATAIQLRFDIGKSSLSDEVKEKLMDLRDRRISKKGVVTITSRRHRSQEKNREAALLRLQSLVRKVLEPKKVRKKTKPTKASLRRHRQQKLHRSKTKELRRKINPKDL
ncbi:MAG: alternative ribosome rescue aminoacyl-tRNA hydrolase ArfB [Saprospiraceae bacterium]|nr:alternative ribosome rescue aminoacyl-tRNA hydrolase ArfB [Saprospiraceae bacterium]